MYSYNTYTNKQTDKISNNYLLSPARTVFFYVFINFNVFNIKEIKQTSVTFIFIIREKKSITLYCVKISLQITFVVQTKIAIQDSH